MNKNIEHQYLKLLKDILDNGVEKQDRTGTGTISVFGRQIRHDMKLGFPLLTTKKMHWRSIVGELLWFLKGSTDIRELWKDDIKIWDGDWYKQYKTSCSEPYSLGEIKDKVKVGGHYFHDSMFDLGPIYGKQWRNWDVPRMESKGFDFDTAWEKSQKIWKSSNGMECGPSFEAFCMSLLRIKEMGIAYGYHTQIDQISNLINDLKQNPDSRRLMVNAWNVGELEQMTLPPCHFSFQCYSHEKEGKRYLSLAWNQRSCDVGLGIPFNIASYGLLLEIIAKEVNMIPYELIGNLGDCHIYNNHIEPIKEQLNRESYPLPKLIIDQFDEYNHYIGDMDDISEYNIEQFKLENYQSCPHIKLPLSN